MVMTTRKIQGEQGRVTLPVGTVQGNQLKGQGGEHTDPAWLGLTPVSIKIS